MNNTFLLLMFLSVATLAVTSGRAESGLYAGVWLGQTANYFAAVATLFLPEPGDWPIILMAISTTLGLIMAVFQYRQTIKHWLVHRRWENEGGW